MAQATDKDTSELNELQQVAFDKAAAGENIFLTGGPGVGKSHTCRAIIEERRAKYPGKVLVVAPTGVAAQQLGGQTINATPGPWLPSGTTEAFTKNMLSTKSRRTWGEMKVLVIDEVSMVGAEFLDWYMWAINESVVIQVIICGDFSQLPPIPSTDGSLDSPLLLERENMTRGFGRGAYFLPFGLKECSGMYAFQSHAWRSLGLDAIVLTDIHRTEDTVLIRALTAIRKGDGECEDIQTLVNATRRNLPAVKGVEPTTLYCTRKNVASFNAIEMDKLDQSTLHAYSADDTALPCTYSAACVDALMRNVFFKTCQAESKVELCMGCQVMIVQGEPGGEGETQEDIDTRLVNGSRGVVIGFRTDEHSTDLTEYPVVRFATGREKLILPVQFTKDVYRVGKCSRRQVPLILAWAITMHKSQGMSINRLKVDLGGVFEAGQAYVAISRSTGSDGLQIANYEPRCVIANPLALGFSIALNTGTMDDFVEASSTWWAPVMNHRLSGWRELYMSNPAFKHWEKCTPQREKTIRRREDTRDPEKGTTEKRKKKHKKTKE